MQNNADKPNFSALFQSLKFREKSPILSPYSEDFLLSTGFGEAVKPSLSLTTIDKSNSRVSTVTRTSQLNLRGVKSQAGPRAIRFTMTCMVANKLQIRNVSKTRSKHRVRVRALRVLRRMNHSTKCSCGEH